MVNKWDINTKYQVAFADMIEQRTTMMKFLFDEYGIEAVEKFFLIQNPTWSEQIKVGKIKKFIAKALSKLMPHQIMKKVTEIIIEQAQYLVGMENITIKEITDDYEVLEIINCPVFKQFKKTLKVLKFENLEERYICTFACIPIIKQMAAVGNLDVTGEYYDNGCQLRVIIKMKETEELEQVEGKSIP